MNKEAELLEELGQFGANDDETFGANDDETFGRALQEESSFLFLFFLIICDSLG